MTEAELLRIAQERADEAQEVAQAHNERGEADLRFLAGDQYPEEVRRVREEAGQPCLVVNSATQFVRRVTDQIRRMNPAIRVVSSDAAANKDVAEIYEGLIRNIEYESDASSVYEFAAEQAASSSIGWFRVRNEYEDEASFDQKAVIERVFNSFSVLPDPMARMPDRSDMRYCFILEEMPRKDFEATYPDADQTPISEENRAKTTGSRFTWETPDTVTVAEYYWIEHKDAEIGLLPTGQVVQSPFPAGVPILQRRKVRVPQVKWAKITANSVLEGPIDVPCRYIPVIAVTGEELHIGETTYRSSVIRWAKDPMMLYNYAVSTNAEIVGGQSKAPWLLTAKQVQGLESYWQQANRTNLPYLIYNPDEKATEPKRVQPPVSSEGLITVMQMASEDAKRTTGIYDASLGARSNETSGVAIERRQMEADAATSIYADNMVKAIRHCGAILVDMIPRIYDRERTVVLLGEDGQEKLETINSMMMSQNGPVPVNDLTIGKYAVRVQVGMSHNSKREAAAQGMMEFLRVSPAAAPLISDIIAKMQDWPESDRVAERLRKALPPGMAEEAQDDLSPQEQQQRQMQMMQAQQEQQLAKQMQIRKAEAEVKEAEAKAAEAEADAVKARIEAEAMMAQRGLMAAAMTAGPMMPGVPM